jgi:signal transduction histidine kinase
MNISFSYSDAYNILLGILMMMFLYNAVTYGQTRRKENLYYCAYVFFQWLFLFQLKNDILSRVPIQETWQLAMTRPAVLLMYNVFGMTLLELKEKHQKLYRYTLWNNYIILVMWIIVLYFCCIGQPNTARKVIDLGKLPIFAMGILVVIGMMRNGSTTARYFVLGSFLLMGLESLNISLNVVCHTMEGAKGVRYLSPDSLLAYPNFFSKIGILLDLFCLNLGLNYHNQKLLSQALQAELDKQRALEAERSRIARDMHDDLGSGLSALLLLSTTVHQTNNVTNPQYLKDSLQRIATISAELGRRLREVIWTVSVDDDNLESLVFFIRRYTTDFCSTQQLKLMVKMPHRFQPIIFSGEKRRNIFLCTKEILNNTVKYAQASDIEFIVEVFENQLFITIKDNGIGFDYTEASQRGGNGLRNMQARMAQIGGTCTLETQNGTTVRLGLTF